MTWTKVLAGLSETATANKDDDKVRVCEWLYAYPFSKEPEPEHREQRVLQTRSWHDPVTTGRIR